MKSRVPLLLGASSVLLASALSMQCMAQSGTPLTARVVTTHVKPDMLNEWLDLEKNEVVPALKKGTDGDSVRWHSPASKIYFDASLDNAGIAGNTLVIFTSDNGCSPVADISYLESQGHYPSADRRGYKADIWDGGHRIPFVAHWTEK